MISRGIPQRNKQNKVILPVAVPKRNKYVDFAIVILNPDSTVELIIFCTENTLEADVYSEK